MTNFEYIKSLNEEELALWLIHDTIIEDEDEDYDGNMYSYNTYMVETPNGAICYDTEEAIEETLRWFKEKHDDK